MGLLYTLLGTKLPLMVNSFLFSSGTSAEAMDTSAEVLCLELAQQKKLLFCGLRTGTVMIYPLDFPLETLCIPPLEEMPQVHKNLPLSKCSDVEPFF